MRLQTLYLQLKILRARLVKEVFAMNEIDSLREQIEKTKIVLAESEENFKKNPNDYSAKLLLMSTENYLADLIAKFERLKGQA